MKKPRYLGYKIKILGHSWTVFYCTPRYFKQQHPEMDDALAVSVKEDKYIYLQNGHLKRETVIHELTHAYLWMLCVTSCDLDTDAITEVFCDLLAMHGEKILKQADEVLAAFKILKGRTND